MNNDIRDTNFIAIWSKCIDIQMHFNTLNLTIKSLAITAFTFFFAGIGYLYKEKVYLEDVNVLMWFSIMGALIIFLFYFIDRYWYHQFLKATSIHISNIESLNVLDDDLKSALEVSKKISEESKKPINGILLNSLKRTNIFYFILAVPFLTISVYAGIKHKNTAEDDRFKALEVNFKKIEEAIKRLERETNTSLLDSAGDHNKFIKR